MVASHNLVSNNTLKTWNILDALDLLRHSLYTILGNVNYCFKTVNLTREGPENIREDSPMLLFQLSPTSLIPSTTFRRLVDRNAQF